MGGEGESKQIMHVRTLTTGTRFVPELMVGDAPGG